MTALTANDIVVVPIRSGVGLRLGANVGYVKFTPRPTGNPFDRRLPASTRRNARWHRVVSGAAVVPGLG